MNKKRFIKLLLLALIVKFAFGFFTRHIDVFNHMDWGIRFFEYGAKEFYNANVWNFTWPNQPPGTMYMFAVIRKLYEFIFEIFWQININISIFPSGIISFFEANLYPALLKLPAILADIGIAYLIYKLLNQHGYEKVSTKIALVFLINPVVWYNSSIWGQYDSVINFLALLSVYFLLKRNLIFAFLALAGSIYIKASLLIFVPLFFVFALMQKYELKEWGYAVVSVLLIFGLLTYPFADKNTFVWLYELYKDKIFVDQLQVITANAFNIWAGIKGINQIPHSNLLGPFTYRTWGVLMFGIAYIPSIYLIYKKQDFSSSMWALAIAAFSSFMLLTNMHERYLYPLFIPFTVLLAIDRKLLKLYVLISAINLLNLYNFWWTPRIEPLVELMTTNNKLLPRTLGFFNFGLFLIFYKRFFDKTNLHRYN